MTSPLESLVLDSLALNDGTAFDLEAFEFNPAPKRQRWISGEDADGDVLAEPSHAGNRPATITLRVAPQASMDLALAKIGQIQDKLYESEQQPDGLPLVWTPHDATKQATAKVLSGEITDLPVTLDAGWFANAPSITLRLDCLPYMEGTEVTSAATVTNTDPIQLLTVSGVTGDVPAKARLVVTDAATQSRRHVEWGVQWRHYDAATSLLIDSDSLVTSGFAGTGTTRTGAYDNPVAGNSVIRGTLTTSPVAVCGVGNLGHVGTFRVKARVYPVIASQIAADINIRFSWKDGDGPLRSNGYTSVPAAKATFYEVDLGLISIPEKALGTQRWTGQVEAFSSTTGDTLDVDYIVLIPAGEGYGKARAPLSFATPTAFTQRDTFSQTAGNLTGKTADVGGSWTGIGSANDFTVETTGHTAQRTAVSDSSALTGPRFVSMPSSLTSFMSQVDIKFSAVPASETWGGGLSFRGVDINNFAVLELLPWASGVVLSYRSVVAGSLNAFYNVPISSAFATTNTWFTMRVAVDTQGSLMGWIVPQGSTFGSPTVVVTDPDLATGGVLASGVCGIFDHKWDAVAATRNYDNYWAASASSDAVVFSGRAAEIRHDGAIRQDSTGTYYGPVRSYRGAHFYLPPAGDEGRPSRVLAKSRRNDIDAAADDQIADSTTATIHYTPRYSSVPR